MIGVLAHLAAPGWSPRLVLVSPSARYLDDGGLPRRLREPRTSTTSSR